MSKIRYLSVSPELEDRLDRLLRGELQTARLRLRKRTAVTWIALGVAMTAALTAWVWFLAR